MILLIGDPRCNFEQIQPDQEYIKLYCLKVYPLHFYNTCWVSSKCCSIILEVFKFNFIYLVNFSSNNVIFN